MAQSENIDKLAGALVILQAVVKMALKDSQNPHFRSGYADLESIWDASRAALTSAELAVTQMVDYVHAAWEHSLETTDRTSGDITVTRKSGELTSVLVTTVMHSSGQWISGTMPLYLSKADPQGQGSAITYARRYAMAAALGVVQSDDDGNAASAPMQHKGQPQQRPAPSQGYQKPDINLGGILSEASNAGWKIPDAKKFLSDKFQTDVAKLVKLPAEELRKGLEALLANSPKKQQAGSQTQTSSTQTQGAEKSPDGYPVREIDEPDYLSNRDEPWMADDDREPSS